MGVSSALVRGCSMHRLILTRVSGRKWLSDHRCTRSEAWLLAWLALSKRLQRTSSQHQCNLLGALLV